MTEGTKEQGRVVGGMRSRAGPWLAWSLAALCVTLYVLTIPMFLLARSAHVPSGWGVDLTISFTKADIHARPVHVVFTIMVGTCV